MLETVCQLARDAGAAIMQVYDGQHPVDVSLKKDDSPVTAADLAAHRVIKDGLAAAFLIFLCCQKKTRQHGKFASAGSAIGWSIRWMAPKNS